MNNLDLLCVLFLLFDILMSISEMSMAFNMLNNISIQNILLTRFNMSINHLEDLFRLNYVKYHKENQASASM